MDGVHDTLYDNGNRMLNVPVPYEKLLLFQEKLGLDNRLMAQLEPHRDIFISRKGDFAAYFHNVFLNIPETRLILEYEQETGRMIRIWTNWFEVIFRSELDNTFFSYLWKIGLRHVEVNLDQRFSNLGFSVIRQFCHMIILSDIPHGNRTVLLQTVDRLLDFCLLVETSAYIEATTRCDIEIIKGIADRVRNPVTVIGGNIRRLQKNVDTGSSAYGVYESLIGENQRLEYMVSDIKMYFEIFQEAPLFRMLLLQKIIGDALLKLQKSSSFRISGVAIDIPDNASAIKADQRDMEYMFYHLIQNSLEAADPDHPSVRISSRQVASPHHGIEVEIFNNGIPIETAELEKLYSPFFSAKPKGTGFGLPIVRLALRKNFGRISFHPVPGEGTKVFVTLPAAEEF